MQNLIYLSQNYVVAVIPLLILHREKLKIRVLFIATTCLFFPKWITIMISYPIFTHESIPYPFIWIGLILVIVYELILWFLSQEEELSNKILGNIYLLIAESTGRNIWASSSKYDCVLVTTELPAAISCSVRMKLWTW